MAVNWPFCVMWYFKTMCRRRSGHGAVHLRKEKVHRTNEFALGSAAPSYSRSRSRLQILCFNSSTLQRYQLSRSLCSPRHYGLFNPAAFDREKRAEPRPRAFCTCHASVRRGLRRQRLRGVCHFICLITPARSPVRILAGQCLWCIHLRREKAKSICT